MNDKEKPRIPGKKKHGDFSKFSKRKSSGPSGSAGSKPSKSHKTGRLIKKKFSEDDEARPESRKPRFPADKAKGRRIKKTSDYLTDGGLIRLNKYIANAGICSRRDANNLISTGTVLVNGEVVAELGAKVKSTDKVQIGDQTLRRETLKYFLLNKPKGYITTTDDPQERKTVMHLIDKACKERIYPVGRLDRSTTGLLLFTNDGDMAKKLTHPKHQHKKIYHVYTDKAVSYADLEKIAAGVNLDDGLIKPDDVAYVGDGIDKKEVGIELHSGKNRVVRRIFESLNYKVTKLDRVFFAGLTKKDLPRGRYRALTTEEINRLHML